MTFLCDQKRTHSPFRGAGRLKHVIRDNLTPCPQVTAIHSWIKVNCVLASFNQLLFYTNKREACLRNSPHCTHHVLRPSSLYTPPEELTGCPYVEEPSLFFNPCVFLLSQLHSSDAYQIFRCMTLLPQKRYAVWELREL